MLLPRFIAHRGYAAVAPENTLSAIKAAAEAGISWIELEVQLLADGTPIVWHDAHMARCSNSRAFLQEITLEEAQRFDVGGWFSADFNGERIATLKEVLGLVNTLDLGLILELKVSTARNPIRLTEQVIPLLHDSLPKERLIVASMNQDALYRARHLAPELNLGIRYDDKVPRVWRWDVERIGAACLIANWENLYPAIVEETQQMALDLICYTVNDPKAFKPWWKLGVNSVITDDPTLFKSFEPNFARRLKSEHALG